MNFKEKIVDKCKRFFKRALGRVHLPEELKQTDEIILLHISDTPESIYPYLFKLIDNLAPDLIIHTGDLVDNFKLEEIKEVEKNLKKE